MVVGVGRRLRASGRRRPDRRAHPRRRARRLVARGRTAAYTIIEGKGATNLAIGLAAVRIMRSVADDERSVLPVSVHVDVDGVGPVCLSLPSVVGRQGVVGRLDPALDDVERRGLRASAVAIRAGDRRRAQRLIEGAPSGGGEDVPA